ncbi:hypothetical protein BD310DRAFT_835486, partial [Dichomitus squalens]
ASFATSAMENQSALFFQDWDGDESAIADNESAIAHSESTIADDEQDDGMTPRPSTPP